MENTTENTIKSFCNGGKQHQPSAWGREDGNSWERYIFRHDRWWNLNDAKTILGCDKNDNLLPSKISDLLQFFAEELQHVGFYSHWARM